MNVRPYTASDFHALVELWREVFPDDPPHNEPSQVLQQKLSVDQLVFVVELEREIVAACMAGYDGHRGWLYAVAVRESSRKQGLGKQLVNYAISALQQLGCKKVNLQIRAGNSAVTAFYQSLGFAVEERTSMGRHL